MTASKNPQDELEKRCADAYQRGYAAYLGPMRGKTNPFPVNSPEFERWGEGFWIAQADAAW
jgi:hypothetical protein